MRVNRLFAAALILAALAGPLPAQATAARQDGPAVAEAPPTARRGDHLDVHHGVRVPDPYRWMEAMDAPETRAWVEAQDRWARAFTAGPRRDAVRDRIALVADVRRPGAPLRGGDLFVYLEFPATGPGAGTSAFVQDGVTGRPRVLIAADEELRPGRGALTRVFPSPDGRHVAYTTSLDGSRWETLRVREVASGRDLDDELTGVHGGFSGVTWAPDGSGFYYDRLPLPTAGEERSARIAGERVAFHRLGAAQDEDEAVFARPEAPLEALSHGLTEDGRWIVVVARPPEAAGDRVFLIDGRSRADVRPIVDEPRASYTFVGGRGDRLLFQTDDGAPRGRVVAAVVETGGVSWEEVIPEVSETITTWAGVNWVGDRVFVTYLADAALRIRAFELDGRHAYDVRLPTLGSIWSGVVGRPGDEHAFYVLSGVVDPGTVHRLDVATGASTVFHRPDLAYAPEDFLTEQVFYHSADGTRIPMYLVRRRDLPRDGRAPAIVYGYGSFGWSAAPWFQPHLVAWLERGGVWALPNTRGGGEYGEAWHQAGARRNKPTAIADFIAAAEWLVESGWTRADRLVANGSSAGGPVVAAAALRRPELFGAVLLDFPALDVLRYHEFTGAVAGGWPAEYGTVADPEEFEVLRAYSPYHNLTPGTCHPPTLVAPGERDEITPPLHAYKYVAALRAAQGCDHPVMLRVSWGAGHSFGATPQESFETWADQLSFLQRVLGLEAASAEPAPASAAARRRDRADPARGR